MSASVLNVSDDGNNMLRSSAMGTKGTGGVLTQRKVSNTNIDLDEYGLTSNTGANLGTDENSKKGNQRQFLLKLPPRKSGGFSHHLNKTSQAVKGNVSSSRSVTMP